MSDVGENVGMYENSDGGGYVFGKEYTSGIWRMHCSLGIMSLKPYG